MVPLNPRANDMITCRQATQLASKQRDVALTWRERLSLRLHLLVCAMCRRYERQLGFLGRVAAGLEQAMERHGHASGGLDERRRAEILEAVRRRAADDGGPPAVDSASGDSHRH
jgi:hypothetical protein